MKTLNEVAESYFNTLNPIAERISADIVAIKDAYEGLWNCLSYKERNQIINETVVQPEAVLKYTLGTKICEGVNPNFPLITRQTTGAKYIVDDNTGLSWRDEHSAPFSWKTPSQIDLSIFSASNGEVEMKNDNTFQIYNKSQEADDFSSCQIDKSYTSIMDKENNKKSEKNDRKNSTTPLSHNVVLVGTCSKLSGLCSKLKFLPGKSYSYEVQTVVANPTTPNEGSFLDKIKATAVLKFQSTLKLVGGKTSTEKKLAENKETENLVQPKNAATIVRLQKPSPKIAKPKSPPPPPPVVKPTQIAEEKDGNKGGKNLIFIRNSKNEKSQDEKNSETAVLLGENSVQSFLSADRESLDQDLQSKVTHDLSDDLNSMSTECTPLSGPIPKSGFDFLDNW